MTSYILMIIHGKIQPLWAVDGAWDGASVLRMGECEGEETGIEMQCHF